jgi:hypothetical protein
LPPAPNSQHTILSKLENGTPPSLTTPGAKLETLPIVSISLRKAVLVAALAIGMVACASAPVVPVAGTAADLRALVGEWDGRYTSDFQGRSGTIWFKLAGGEQKAQGDVRMIVEGGTTPYTPYRPKVDAKSSRDRDAIQFLSISFVRIDDTTVSGALDPYWDPACDCRAVTTFIGQVVESRMAGTFETRLANGDVARGRWEARRRPPGR